MRRWGVGVRCGAVDQVEADVVGIPWCRGFQFGCLKAAAGCVRVHGWWGGGTKRRHPMRWLAQRSMSCRLRCASSSTNTFARTVQHIDAEVKPPLS